VPQLIDGHRPPGALSQWILASQTFLLDTGAMMPLEAGDEGAE
jgi:hypothetical protein